MLGINKLLVFTGRTFRAGVAGVKRNSPAMENVDRCVATRLKSMKLYGIKCTEAKRVVDVLEQARRGDSSLFLTKMPRWLGLRLRTWDVGKNGAAVDRVADLSPIVEGPLKR